MRYARIAVLLGVLLSTLVAGSTMATAQGKWNVVVPKTNVAEKIRKAAFLNEKVGIWGGAGDIGKAHYTLDGGKTWTVADTSGG